MHTRPRVTQKLLCRTGSSAQSCDALEGRDGEWGWRAWEEAQGGGSVCVHLADSLCCTAETTVKQLYSIL